MANNKNKISPNLWFDKEAREAAQLYTTVFKNAKTTGGSIINNTPSGKAEIVTIEIEGQEFTLLSAGPFFKFNPSVSFLVSCGSKEELDKLWAELIKNGGALMELGAYPFAERYGWLSDRYGLSWQLMYMPGRTSPQKITPTLMFVGKNCGKAEEAINLYLSTFSNSKMGDVMRYGKAELPDKEGTIRHANFTLEGEGFAAMDSALQHNFAFNEAISFIVHCDTQKEIDYCWGRLTADPAAEQCGWLKDKYGLSWQIVPAILNELMSDKDPKKVARVTEAFLKMKKFDIAKLKAAYKG